MKSPLKRFTESEARNLLRQRVQTIVQFVGVPVGTTGTVVDVERVAEDEYNVVVKWNARDKSHTQESRFAKNGYEEALRVRPDKVPEKALAA